MHEVCWMRSSSPLLNFQRSCFIFFPPTLWDSPTLHCGHIYYFCWVQLYCNKFFECLSSEPEVFSIEIPWLPYVYRHAFLGNQCTNDRRTGRGFTTSNYHEWLTRTLPTRCQAKRFAWVWGELEKRRVSLSRYSKREGPWHLDLDLASASACLVGMIR